MELMVLKMFWYQSYILQSRVTVTVTVTVRTTASSSLYVYCGLLKKALPYS